MGRHKGKDELKCLVCAHKDRKTIEKAMLDGATLRNISKQFGPSAPTLCRHKAHIAQTLALASAQRGTALGESLLQKLDRMETDFARLSRRAELLGELPSAIVALREMRETLKVIQQVRQSERGHGPEEEIVTVRIIHVGGFNDGDREWLQSECTLINGVPGIPSSHAKILPESAERSSSEIPRLKGPNSTDPDGEDPL